MNARSPSLLFEHLNLRRNPFFGPSLEEWAELAVVELSPYLERLARPPFVLQFMGDMGRGKTTHLLALNRAMPGSRYVYLPPEGRLPSIPKADVQLVDETQRLSRWARRRLFRRARSLVIGTHEDHAAELERLRVPFETVVLDGTLTPELLNRMIRRRVEAARRGPGPVPELSEASVRRLTQDHGDNVRAMFDRLYTVFQDLEEIGSVQV